MRWIETDKGDPRCRELADRHYTRQSIGHPMWTRPGWNMVLLCEQKNGRRALFCWFRPKWESGILGTERKDGLRCIECSMFRNETRFRSSHLIIEAVQCLLTWEHAQDVDWYDGIITGVNSQKTASGRNSLSLPGKCFREAGFVDFYHPGKNRADVWLKYALKFPKPIRPQISERLKDRRMTNKESERLDRLQVVHSSLRDVHRIGTDSDFPGYPPSIGVIMRKGTKGYVLSVHAPRLSSLVTGETFDLSPDPDDQNRSDSPISPGSLIDDLDTRLRAELLSQAHNCRILSADLLSHASRLESEALKDTLIEDKDISGLVDMSKASGSLDKNRAREARIEHPLLETQETDLDMFD